VSGPLDGYDAVLLDLDGTVIRGTEVVPGAPDVVNELRQAGRAVQFITNNASRAPEEVAKHLTALGIRTAPEEVVTSAQAAAALLATQLPAGAAVLVVGAEALVAAVRSVGLRPVAAASGDPWWRGVDRVQH
jgi:glycerol 3-phosphatase-2